MSVLTKLSLEFRASIEFKKEKKEENRRFCERGLFDGQLVIRELRKRSQMPHSTNSRQKVHFLNFVHCFIGNDMKI